MEIDIEEILKEKPDAKSIALKYFACKVNRPRAEDLQQILDALYRTDKMPKYFTFEVREIIDAKNLARELIDRDLKRSEEEDYLKQRYEETPVIREVYKDFQMFKGSVLQEALLITEGQAT